MNNLAQTWFISDLHLEATDPKSAQFFFTLLEKVDSSVDAIFILGDLFEAWIGDDDLSPFHLSIMNALNKVTSKNIPVYLLHGNRDFLIGKRFLKATGCKLIIEETKINLYGHFILLLHGDSLCTNDQKYITARKKLRHPFTKTLFLSLPLFIRKYFANLMRNKSKQHMQTLQTQMMDVTKEAVNHVMSKHQVQYIIHGHTHKRAIHELKVNTLPAKRIVLGDWQKQANVLVWKNNNNFDFVLL